MILKRIVVKGKIGLSVNFDKINYILGENETGKTTFIKLILYSLGTNIDSFIDEIVKEDSTDQVELDVKLKSGNVYRFIRKLPYSETIIVLPLNESNEVIEENVEIKNLEEFSDMLLIEEGYGAQEIPYGKNNKANLRYYFMLRAVTADQETPAYKVLADLGGSTKSYINNQSLIKKAIIEAILGKENTEVQKSRLKLQELFKERNALLSKIKIIGEVISSYILKNKESSEILKMKDTKRIRKKIEDIKNEREKLSAEQSKYISKLETTNSKINDKLSRELNKQLSKARNDVNQLILQRDDIKEVCQTMSAEIEKLKKMIIARQLITLIPVEICPVCLQEISPTTRSDDSCSYCKNEIKNNDFESISKYKRMLEETLFEANKVSDELLVQIDRAELDKRSLLRKVEKVKEKFIKEQVEKNTPFENLIQSIKDRVEKLTKDEQVLEVHLGHLMTIDELKLQKIQLEADINILKDKLEQLEKNIYYSDVDELESWEEIFKEELNYVFGTERAVSLDSNYTPIVGEINIRNISSASLKVASRLTYITSLFHLSEDIDINHLGFILLDSPKDKDLDTDKYERFLEVLEKSNKGQIILTGSIKEMHLYNSANIILTLSTDNKLLQ